MWPCHFHVTHKHKYHFILCGCTSVHVRTRDFRHKHSFRRQTQSFCQTSHKSFRRLPLAHLHASVGQIRPGNHRWPQHSRPGNTQLHPDCCLCTHTHTHTHTQTRMWKVIFFSCSRHKKAPVLIIWRVKVMSMNRSACDCIFTNYFVLAVRTFPNKSIPVTTVFIIPVISNK